MNDQPLHRRWSFDPFRQSWKTRSEDEQDPNPSNKSDWKRKFKHSNLIFSTNWVFDYNITALLQGLSLRMTEGWLGLDSKNLNALSCESILNCLGCFLIILGNSNLVYNISLTLTTDERQFLSDSWFVRRTKSSLFSSQDLLLRLSVFQNPSRTDF